MRANLARFTTADRATRDGAMSLGAGMRWVVMDHDDVSPGPCLSQDPGHNDPVFGPVAGHRWH